MANKQRDAAKERIWRDVLKRHAASGLSVRAFCRREKLAESAFYAWRRTITERNGEAKPAPRAPAFVPVAVTGQPRREADILVELAGGRTLRLPEAILPERLAELVRALEAQSVR